MKAGANPSRSQSTGFEPTQRQAMYAYQLIYSVTSSNLGTLKICDRCCHCESTDAGERVVLLPYEKEYIESLLTELGRVDDIPLLAGITRDGRCPFHRGQKCSLHPARPVDCRSYPVVPRFVGGDVELHLGVNCPSRGAVASEFKLLWASIWHSLLPYLPEAWRVSYNETNALLYGTPVIPEVLGSVSPMQLCECCESVRSLVGR